MSAHPSDLENLSISELESLLAERRRRQSSQVLRTISQRTTSPPPLSGPPGAGLVAPAAAAQGRVTRRLRPAEVPATPMRSSAPGMGHATPLPTPVDRFRRSSLGAVAQARPGGEPGWLRGASLPRTADRALQALEIAFCALLLYVVAQWVYTDFLSDGNVAADMAPVPAAPGLSPARAPRAAAPPALPAAGTGAARLTAAVAAVAATIPTGTPALSDRDSMIAARRFSPGRPAPRVVPRLRRLLADEADAALSEIADAPMPAAATIAAPQVATPAAADRVESNPYLPTEIRIPRISLDARVREVTVRLDTWEWEVAAYMAGHHTGTASPGETGNVVIAGHRDMRGSVFLHLDQLQKGDDIFVASGRGVFHYVVRKSFIVRPSQVEVMAPTTDARLTLITCTPVKIASHRLIVIADLDAKYVAPDRGGP